MNKDNSKANFDGSSIKKGFKYIFDSNGKVVAGINKKNICNKKGNVIAKFLHYEKVGNAKFAIYKSNKGTFKYSNNRLYFNNKLCGHTIRKRINIPYITTLMIINILLLTSIIVIGKVDIKTELTPVISIMDTNGEWTTHGTVAVLDETIHPNTNGEYCFDIKNENKYQIVLSFAISDLYNGDDITGFPLLFRVKVEDTYFQSEWVASENLLINGLKLNPQEKQSITLEWWWPFESGDDNKDTLYGIDNGKYTLVLKVASEACEK